MHKRCQIKQNELRKDSTSMQRSELVLMSQSVTDSSCLLFYVLFKNHNHPPCQENRSTNIQKICFIKFFNLFYWHRVTSVEFSERARLSAAPAGCQVDKPGASQLDPSLKTSTPLLGSQPIYNLQSSTTAPSNTRELWFTVNNWLILWGHLWMAWGIR